MRSVDFVKIANLIAREHRISVQEGVRWEANIKEKIVYYDPDDVYSLPEDQLLGLLLHETGHVHYTHVLPDSWYQPPEHMQLLHHILNALEDIRIEEKVSKDYPNAREIIDSTRDDILNDLVRDLPSSDVNRFEKPILYASARFYGRGYAKPIMKHEVLGQRVADYMEQKRKEILFAKNTEDLFPFVKEIRDILIQELGHPTDKDRQDMQASLDDKAQPGKPGAGRQHAQGGKGAGSGVRKQQTGGGRKAEKKFFLTAPQLKQVYEITDQAVLLGKRLRNILKRNNATEYAGKYRTGKLLSKRIFKVRTSKDTKPFARAIVKGNKSYAFAIATDVSGSMFEGGRKYENMSGNIALSSALMVADALRIAGAQTAVINFGNYAKVKVPLTGRKLEFAEVANTDGCGGGTKIADAIKALREELIQSNAENRIGIVLTDGGDWDPQIRQECDLAERHGIKIIGIDYESDGLQQQMRPDRVISLKGSRNAKAAIAGTFEKILKDNITLSA